MSTDSFDENCPGCQPAMLDLSTGKPYPANSPTMIKVREVWASMPRDVKEAWHRVSCKNSRADADMARAAIFGQAVEKALTPSS